MLDDETTHELPTRVDHLGWWLLVLALVGATVYVAAHLVGMLVLGVFGYYATRPIRDRLEAVVDSDRLAAVTTVLVVLVPIILLLLSLLFRVVSQVQDLLNSNSTASLLGKLPAVGSLSPGQRNQLRTLLQDPMAALGGQGGSFVANAELGVKVAQALFGGVLLIGLAITLSYVLLSRDDAFADVFVGLVGGRDTTAYAYVAAVDEDLESVFFGNLLFAVVMAVVAAVTYLGTNLVAPDGVQVPMVLVLGALTGVASLIPIIVGKVVYVPVVGYLAVQATESGALPFVAGTLVVYVLVLDVLPQAFVQPYLSGRQLDMMLLLFAYVVGPIVFGWYGLFLLPVLFVLLLEAVRIVLPELLRGTSPRPTVQLTTEPGTDPVAEREDVPEQEENTE
jgi:predicted PurR-regulated permease PerM